MTPAEVLAELPRIAREADSADLPALIGALERAKAEAWARLAAPASAGSGVGNLSATEAARRLGLSKDWLYRNAAELPFAVRIGRRVVFNAAGLDKWTRGRMGR